MKKLLMRQQRALKTVVSTEGVQSQITEARAFSTSASAPLGTHLCSQCADKNPRWGTGGCGCDGEQEGEHRLPELGRTDAGPVLDSTSRTHGQSGAESLRSGKQATEQVTYHAFSLCAWDFRQQLRNQRFS